MFDAVQQINVKYNSGAMLESTPMVAGLGTWCQDVSLGGCPGEFLIYPQKKSFFSKIMEFYIFISDQKDKTKVKQKSQNKLLVSIPEAGLVSKRGRGEMSKAM